MLTPSTRIGDLLHRDHMATIAALEELEALLSRHRKAPAFESGLVASLTALAGAVRTEVEAHFGFEEDLIFPLFLAEGQTAIVEILTQEHRAILPLARRVAGQAEAAVARGGFVAGDWAEFRASGGELIEREMFHLQKEEMGLLAGIALLIDPATDARLAEAFAAIAR